MDAKPTDHLLRTPRSGLQSHPRIVMALIVGMFVLVAISSGCSSVRRSYQIYSNGWNGFARPIEGGTQSALLAADGFEHNKIPVVLIHGLLSDPSTWDETIQQLKADERISARYQFWTYRYPSGQPYLNSAADLRRELATTIAALDPYHQDAALHQVVLVGHSMGGLIAKLQVSNSGDQLWQAFSDEPFLEVAEPKEREELARLVYFSPVPEVKRVVFIATPQSGSKWAQRPLARFGRSIIHFPEEMQEKYQRWILRHPVSLANAPQTIPTSIDHLDPQNPVMQAVARLNISPSVKLHSIVGSGYEDADGDDGDGIVAVGRTRINGAASELVLDTSHSNVHRHPDTTVEIQRILELHAAELGW